MSIRGGSALRRPVYRGGSSTPYELRQGNYLRGIGINLRCASDRKE